VTLPPETAPATTTTKVYAPVSVIADGPTTTTRLALYNCKVEAPSAWSPSKKQWCCREEGLGCQSSCDLPCQQDVKRPTCAEAMLQASADHFRDSANPTLAAYALTLKVCPHCSACNPEEVSQPTAKAEAAAASASVPEEEEEEEAEKKREAAAAAAAAAPSSIVVVQAASASAPEEVETPPATRAATSPTTTTVARTTTGRSTVRPLAAPSLPSRTAGGGIPWPHEPSAASSERKDGRQQVNNCDQTCTIAGERQSCGARVRVAAAMQSEGDSDVCFVAYSHVLQHCPSCSSCELEDTDCTAEPTTSTTSPPYSCEKTPLGRVGAAAGWSAPKIDWCCANEKLGCPDKSAATTTSALRNLELDPYVCEETPLYPLGKWTSGQLKWCCSHKKVGCPDGKK